MARGTISFTSSGSFAKTEAYLKRLQKNEQFKILDRLGREGVSALSGATPVDTEKTAHAWRYVIEQSADGSVSLIWVNDNVVGGAPLAILLQYGHGTGTGGYVQGRDYINPVMRPVFDRIADEVWKAVTG